MYKETKDSEKSVSDEFKALKEAKELITPGSFNSDAIKGVQSFLNDEGYTDSKGESLRVDGRYGAATANAVMKYQKDNNLDVDGIVGDKTWNSIYNKKKELEENDAFIEGLKNKSGGFYYDRMQNIRKAQRGMGITPSGKIDDDYITADLPFKLNKNENSAREKLSDKIYDVWKTGYNPSSGNKEEENDDFHKRVRRRWENPKEVRLSGNENPVQVKPMSEESDNKKVKFSIDEQIKQGLLPTLKPENIYSGRFGETPSYMEAFEEVESEKQNEDDGAWQNDPKREELKKRL